MKVLELFAGTRSIGRAFEKRGHEVFSIDWDDKFKDIDWNVNINEVTAEDILQRFGHPDVIWASPDCTTYSVAAIQRHRRKSKDGDLVPVSEYAKKCDITNRHVIELIRELNPTYYFVENPRGGGLRKMSWMEELPRYTVTYCQYGDIRMKPTDIWTNHPHPKFKPMCKPRDNCHEQSPRGVTIRAWRDKGIYLGYNGTTGLKNKVERAKIPEELCEHIVDICEGKQVKLAQIDIWEVLNDL